jgi:hypothetical protein
LLPVWRAPDGFQVDDGFAVPEACVCAVALAPAFFELDVVVVVVPAAGGFVVSQPASAAATERESAKARMLRITDA